MCVNSASYMIATTASLAAFSAALGRDMPITPLRPNILLREARKGTLKPWVEDWWSELIIGDSEHLFIHVRVMRDG